MSGLELAALPALMKGAGTAISAFSAVAGAEGQATQMKYRSKLQEFQANEEAAASQRAAALERRKAERATGRARAVAAAGGGSTEDINVVDAQNRIAAQGEFNALSRLAEGQSRYNALRSSAKAQRQGARMTRRQGILAATGTILDGGSSLYDMYGGKPGRSP